MTRLLTISALVVALSLLTGCMREDSENVNQDRIWAHYELFYNANEDITYARATFRFGHAAGTRLELTDPSEVRFNGTPIMFRPALAYYERAINGYIPEGTFDFTDLDGNTYTNDVEIREIAHPADVAPIDRSQAFAYPWDGDAVSSRENVTLVVTGGNNGGTETFTTSAIGATELVLPVTQLEKLAPGNANAVMDRTFTPQISQATSAGGLVTGRYRAVNKGVILD